MKKPKPSRLFLMSALCMVTYPAISTAMPGLVTEASVGAGYDSNIFHTPNKTYFDYFSGGVPTQKLQSGLFLPLDISIALNKEKKNPGAIFVDYNLGGDFYTDIAHKNANNWGQELGAGKFVSLAKPGENKRQLEARFFVHQESKLYIDPDSGDKKLSSKGEDVSEKYSYLSLGAESVLDMELNKQWDVDIGADIERFDFKTPVRGSEYDHTYFGAFADLSFTPMRRTKLKASMDFYSKFYDFREARDLTGSTVGKRPLLKYSYTDISLSWRQRFHKKLVTYLDYDFSQRRDLDVGYNDRTAQGVGVRALLDLTPALSTKFKVSYSKNEYPRALAFDTPASGLKKTYSRVYLNWSLDYEISKDMILEAVVKYYDTNTNDTRYDYERNVISVGVVKDW